MGCVIGVDVGSQSLKAVVADAEGRALATASARPPGAGLGRDDVTMLGLAYQVDGLVALDARLRPAIIWLDRRATDQSAALAEAVSEPEIVGRTGLNPDASHIAPKAMSRTARCEPC